MRYPNHNPYCLNCLRPSHWKQSTIVILPGNKKEERFFSYHSWNIITNYFFGLNWRPSDIQSRLSNLNLNSMERKSKNGELNSQNKSFMEVVGLLNEKQTSPRNNYKLANSQSCNQCILLTYSFHSFIPSMNSIFRTSYWVHLQRSGTKIISCKVAETAGQSSQCK